MAQRIPRAHAPKECSAYLPRRWLLGQKVDQRVMILPAKLLHWRMLPGIVAWISGAFPRRLYRLLGIGSPANSAAAADAHLRKLHWLARRNGQTVLLEFVHESL